MAIAGSLIYDTEIDKSGFNKGLSSLTDSVKSGGTKIKNIVAALGITKIIRTAINTINNSIDGAVSRIDTLNNFPKVMTNLGIATQESTEAINTLSEGLQGIPTTLDDAALATQRFTSKNGDVKKSVNLFLAVNNALLAGGASAEIQSSAMEQLSQAYAKGKPDMIEWRSIQTAMPAQLKQISQEILGNKDSLDTFLKKAKEYAASNPLSSSATELVEQLQAVKAGSGDMTTALGTALRLGIISMDDFMNTIVKLNKEGTGQFQSFEKQAKNATGGINTSITNAKTAITRGVANIIDTIDKSLKKTELQGLGNVISKIGTIAENTLKKVANAISKIDLDSIIKKVKNICIVYGSKLKKILSEIIKLMTNLRNVIQKNKSVLTILISTVLGLVTAFKAYQTVAKAIKTINMIQSFSSMINPVGLLVAGITALTVAVGASAIAMSNQQRSMGGLREEAEAQQTTWKNLKQAREESLESSSAEIVTTQKLADELKTITDENGKVKEGYENRAKYILGELNSALGTEYQMNGNIISQYDKLKDNIDQLIAKKKAEATLEAYKEEYQTALKNQSEATKTLTDLRQRYNDELNKTTHGYREEQEKARNLSHIGKQIKEQTNLIGEYGYTVEKYENLTSASVSNSKDEIEKALSEMGVSYDQAKEKMNTSLTEQIQSQSNYVSLLKQSWQDAKDNNNTFQEEILKKQLETEQQSLINLANSLAQQTSTVSELTEEQKTAWKDLAETSGDAYRQGLSQVPEETRKKIEEATGIIISDISLEKASSNEASSATMLFSNNLKLSNKAEEEVKNVSATIDNDASVENAAENLGQDIDTNFNKKLDGWTWGFDLVKNIYTGLTNSNGIGLITSGASALAQIIKNNIGHSVPAAGPLKDELTYMPDMINNLVKGINQNRYKVVDAASQIAEDIKDSFDLEGLNSDIMREMNRAVTIETGSINATASVKSNNSMLNVIKLQASFDGSVEMDNSKVGRIIAPTVAKTIKAGGLA